jgi:hypothetical protein
MLAGMASSVLSKIVASSGRFTSRQGRPQEILQGGVRSFQLTD